ncbi:bone morphogenetic protein 1 homolog [Penaeus indicus]|uniref:bone morphogenetic protein 1 homolog n=1 Tax=Penaeus indicus TaxID=29960 RepID=UPI00300D7550
MCNMFQWVTIDLDAKFWEFLTYPVEQYHDEHDLMTRIGGSVTGLWQDDGGGFPVVNFAFADAFVNRFAVWRAVIQWQKYTCLVFREVSSTYSGPHLRIQRHADDCKSYVGVISSSGQDFYISEDCERHQGDLLHEFGYAIGLWPTESRTDRDSYVQILEANSLPDVSVNFPIVAENDDIVPYDYYSIMHHHGRAACQGGTVESPLFETGRSVTITIEGAKVTES